MPASVNALCELYVRRSSRRHAPGKTSRAVPGNREQRIDRILAFFWRCCVTPDTIADYLSRAPYQTFLPVPEWNFEGHHADMHFVRHIRATVTPMLAAHSDLYAISTSPFLLARDIVNVLRLDADLVELASTFHGQAQHLLVERVALCPDPTDVWPWVPRWAPAMRAGSDELSPKLDREAKTRIRPELRRWWNVNARKLRPRAFDYASPDYDMLFDQTFTRARDDK